VPDILECPLCRVRLQVPSGTAGRPTVCQACGHRFPIPQVAGGPAQPPPVPATFRPWRRVGVTVAVALAVMLLMTGITAAVLRSRGVSKPPKPSELTDGER
jgi:hypothetical protein